MYADSQVKAKTYERSKERGAPDGMSQVLSSKKDGKRNIKLNHVSLSLSKQETMHVDKDTAKFCRVEQFSTNF